MIEMDCGKQNQNAEFTPALHTQLLKSVDQVDSINII